VESLIGNTTSCAPLLLPLTDSQPSHRHLLNDLTSLLPHTYKDTKLDTKSSNNYNAALNALADLHSCNYIFFFEARKHGQDLYLWLAKAPNGPTIKFSVSNVHTMGELGFGGNCLKGGRGVVVFDKSFEDAEFGGGQEHKGLVRELLRGVFCVPQRGVRGMKPFVDRITGIFGLDGKIWVRVYELREVDKKREESRERSSTDVSLVEVGPRFVLTPIVILEGSFGGPVIYENKEFVSPNQVRSEVRLKKASKHARRTDERKERGVRRGALGLDHRERRRKDPLDTDVLFQ
jgi:ribosome biogenesis protein BRX1